MSDTVVNNYEFIWEIIEFYRIQPRVQEQQVEKIEEYLVLMNAHYQESIIEMDELLNTEDVVCLLDVIDVLNSYLSLVEEELAKIFPENNKTIHPIDVLANIAVNELQTIELFRKFNGGDSNVHQLKEDLDKLETMVYEEDFGKEIVLFTKDLIIKINSDVIIRVDDLL